MNRLASPVASVVFAPFLPANFIGTSVAPALAACDDYLSSSALSSFDRYAKAMDELDRFERRAKSLQTTYLVEYFTPLCARLKTVVQERFSTDPANAPARLSVQQTEKRYPIRADGSETEIQLILRNEGPGTAREVEVTVMADRIDFSEPTRLFPEVAPGRVSLRFAGRVTDADVAESNLFVGLKWHGGDGRDQEEHALLPLLTQDRDIDWEALEFEHPYSLMPIDSSRDLVGRRRVFRKLVGFAQTDAPMAAVIQGQRRVGKTSIAVALESELRSGSFPGVVVVRLLAGRFNAANASDVVPLLGEAICQEILRSEARLAAVVIPSFTDTLAPLVEFARACIERSPNFRLVLIIDEFDGLPVDLYKRGPVANAFFSALRALTFEAWLRLVLIGSEKMNDVMLEQSEQLNNLEVERIDYFRRDKGFDDYAELVRRPADGTLEITDGAVSLLYEWTDGHPYFTKLICAVIWEGALERHDYHVTDDDVRSAIGATVARTDQGKFAHFWSDGISEDQYERYESVARTRRILLASVAHCFRNIHQSRGDADRFLLRRSSVRIKDVIAWATDHLGADSDLSRRELRRFTERDILTSEGDGVGVRVPLFGLWLIESSEQLQVTSIDEDAIERHRIYVTEARVSDSEVAPLLAGWPTFQGAHLDSDRVRAWLNQFGEPSTQRIAFRLLQGITWVHSEQEASWIRAAHERAEVLAAAQRRGAGRLRRVEIDRGRVDLRMERRRGWVVSSLSPPVQQGGDPALVYVKEAGLLRSSVVPLQGVVAAAEQTEGLKGIVLVDRFLGSGDTAMATFERIAADGNQLMQLAEARQVPVVFTPLVAFERGLRRAEKRLREAGASRSTCVRKPCSGKKIGHLASSPPSSPTLMSGMRHSGFAKVWAVGFMTPTTHWGGMAQRLRSCSKRSVRTVLFRYFGVPARQISLGGPLFPGISRASPSDGVVAGSKPGEASVGHLKGMVAGGENEGVEFKASFRVDRETGRVNRALSGVIAKTIAAFMNGNGGYLLIGVGDDGSVCGISEDLASLKRASKDGFELAVREAIGKYLGSEISPHVRIAFATLDDEVIAVVECPRHAEPVYYRENDASLFYVRDGNSSRPLDVAQATKYMRSRQP